MEQMPEKGTVVMCNSYRRSHGLFVNLHHLSHSHFGSTSSCFYKPKIHEAYDEQQN